MSQSDDTRFARFDAAWRAELTTDATSLGVFRIVFVFYLLVSGPPSYAWLGQVPQSLFSPPRLSLAAFAEGFPSYGVLGLLDAVIALSLLAVLVGLKTRAFTTLLLVCIVLGNSFKYSFGKIDHGILLEAVLLVMAVLNWGQRLSLDTKIGKPTSADPNPSLRPLAIVLAGAFLTAGLPKAVSWIDFDASHNGFLSWLYNGYYSQDRQLLLAPWAMQLRPLWIFEVADYSAVVLELGVVVAIFKRRWMLSWLALAGLFHLGNCLVLNIPFQINAFCYLAFIPWSRLLGRVEPASERLVLVLGVLFGVASAVLLAKMSNDVAAILSAEQELVLSAVIWCAVIGVFAWTLIHERWAAPVRGGSRPIPLGNRYD